MRRRSLEKDDREFAGIFFVADARGELEPAVPAFAVVVVDQQIEPEPLPVELRRQAERPVGQAGNGWRAEEVF